MKKMMVLLVAMLTFVSSVFAQVGTIDQDLIYVPIPPCRIFDTRTTQGGTGPIAAGTVKNFTISRTDSYASQGGSATNCGLGAAALNNNFAAAAIALTAVSGANSAYSYLTAFPYGSISPLPTALTPPSTATLNFGAISSDIRNATAIVKLNTDLAQSKQVSIFATHSTEVIGDLVGYYSSPRGTNLACTNPPVNTLVVAPGALGRVAIPACVTFGGSSATGYCTSDGAEMVSYAGTTGISECAMKNIGAAPATITAGRRCCGVPGQRPYF